MPLRSQGEQEADVGTVLGRVGLVGFGEHRSTECERRFVPWRDQPSDRADAVTLHPDKDRLGNDPCDACASLICSDRDHHEIPVIGQWPQTLVLDALMSCDCNDLAVELRYDNTAIQVQMVTICTPSEEPGHDFGNLVKPGPPVCSYVEGFERGGIVSRSVSKDHFFEEISIVEPFADHFLLDAAGVVAILRPFARLLLGGESTDARAAEMR